MIPKISKMAPYLRMALRLYKGLAIVLSTAYIVYIIYDDYVFIERIASLSDVGIFLMMESLYLAMYFFGFSFYYWIIALVVAAVCSIADKKKSAEPKL